MDVISDSNLLDNLLKLVPAGIFWKDKDRRFLGANQMFLDYYGFESVNDLIGKNDEDMGWHIDPEPFRRVELQVINEGKSLLNIPGECIVKGQLRKIRASKCPLYSNGEVIGLIGYFLDVTDEIAEMDRLSFLCQTDDLTGLLNRRAFNDVALEYEIQYRQNESDFALFMIDLDNFKDVNDKYGHEYGDLVLASVAKSLSMIAADNSVLFRYGGDEFVILHQIHSSSDLDSIQKRILRSIDCPRNIEGVKFAIKASVGHALYSETKSLLSLEELADKRMYEMKRQHKKK